MNSTRALLAVLLLLSAPFTKAAEKWRINEWGTFTSLQDERGDAVGGINTDDEPVPPFVHRLATFLLLQPTEIPNNFFQGAPSCHPDVTMRLETPVIYFHPPKTSASISTANVHVRFRGGWLTEFYPYADPDAPGFRDSVSAPGLVRLYRFGPLRSDTESKLSWDDLQIGGNWPLTNTTAHVWTSPRAVQAALVQTTNNESEKFLFYRGVAHINAPLKISRNAGRLVFRSQLENLPAEKPLSIRSLWLVDIRADKKIAFRALPPMNLDSDSNKVLTQTAAGFDSNEFSSGNLGKLKAALESALVAEGLFADEAQALLNTWELSYFKSDGLRVFFLVPRAWTDFYLPLDVSLPAEINRVMVGRIELVTPEQREILREISGFSPMQVQADLGRMWTNFYASTAVTPAGWQRLTEQGRPLAGAVPVPKTYQTYLDLGRFRNALVLDQRKHFSTPALTNFIAMYQLEGYKPVEAAPQAAD